ncbi:MAG TPA: hypothetical protein VGP73_13415 [Thermoanaerobaculia bacterium]
MKSVLALSCGLLSMSMGAQAQEDKAMHLKPFADADHVIYFPTNDVTKRVPHNKAVNLSYHGGPTITSAKVVFIFYGPSFAPGGADNGYATTLQAFRNQFGTNGEYNTITQYTNGSGTHIQLANLGSGTADMFDTTTPPTNVTDSAVKSEVNKYLSTHTYNSSTIYEVVIPRSSYSSSGTSTSCGGPSLAYCAYHGHYSGSSGDVKYAIEPYPSCSGCAVSGWSAVQNEEHFVCHETREAVTDPDLNAWYDSSGNEADDKCAWSPTPFLSGGYGYQYEWSNIDGKCVATK